MPPALLGFLYFLNYDYVSVLFNNPIGVKMLTFTAAGPAGRRLGHQEDRRDQGVKAHVAKS